MSDVVKKEMLKLLEAVIIYQTSYRKWVSPVYVVPNLLISAAFWIAILLQICLSIYN